MTDKKKEKSIKLEAKSSSASVSKKKVPKAKNNYTWQDEIDGLSFDSNNETTVCLRVLPFLL